MVADQEKEEEFNFFKGELMQKYIFLTLIIMSTCLFWIGCSNSVSSDKDVNTSWVFVANEGDYCFENCIEKGNGSISMIDDFGTITQIDNLGNTVQSIEVYKDKLIVIINQDSKIMIFYSIIELCR